MSVIKDEQTKHKAAGQCVVASQGRGLAHTLENASSIVVSSAGLTSDSMPRTSGPNCLRIVTRTSTAAFLTAGFVASS
jgi:hypothetical protein